jgi:hypothetical protein
VTSTGAIRVRPIARSKKPQVPADGQGDDLRRRRAAVASRRGDRKTELLAERGIEVDHVSIYRWVQRFALEFAEVARARQHVIGDRWHVDETYLKVGGTWRYLFRRRR